MLEDKLDQAAGKAKEVAGKVTGDKGLETEGVVEGVDEVDQALGLVAARQVHHRHVLHHHQRLPHHHCGA